MKISWNQLDKFMTANWKTKNALDQWMTRVSIIETVECQLLKLWSVNYWSFIVFIFQMPPTKGNFRKYDQATMEAAIQYVKLHKIGYKTAAKKFNVPRITLKYKVEGKTPIQRWRLQKELTA